MITPSIDLALAGIPEDITPFTFVITFFKLERQALQQFITTPDEMVSNAIRIMQYQFLRMESQTHPAQLPTLIKQKVESAQLTLQSLQKQISSNQKMLTDEMKMIKYAFFKSVAHFTDTLDYLCHQGLHYATIEYALSKQLQLSQDRDERAVLQKLIALFQNPHSSENLQYILMVLLNNAGYWSEKRISKIRQKQMEIKTIQESEFFLEEYKDRMSALLNTSDITPEAEELKDAISKRDNKEILYWTEELFITIIFDDPKNNFAIADLFFTSLNPTLAIQILHNLIEQAHNLAVPAEMVQKQKEITFAERTLEELIALIQNKSWVNHKIIMQHLSNHSEVDILIPALRSNFRDEDEISKLLDNMDQHENIRYTLHLKLIKLPQKKKFEDNLFRFAVYLKDPENKTSRKLVCDLLLSNIKKEELLQKLAELTENKDAQMIIRALKYIFKIKYPERDLSLSKRLYSYLKAELARPSLIGPILFKQHPLLLDAESAIKKHRQPPPPLSFNPKKPDKEAASDVLPTPPPSSIRA